MTRIVAALQLNNVRCVEQVDSLGVIRRLIGLLNQMRIAATNRRLAENSRCRLLSSQSLQTSCYAMSRMVLIILVIAWAIQNASAQTRPLSEFRGFGHPNSGATHGLITDSSIDSSPRYQTEQTSFYQQPAQSVDASPTYGQTVSGTNRDHRHENQFTGGSTQMVASRGGGNSRSVRVNRVGSSDDFDDQGFVRPQADPLVYPVSFDSEQVETPLSQVPRRDPATTGRVEGDVPWTYTLQHLNYADFETKLNEIWGDRLLGTALDDEQRTLRIFFPEGKTAPEASMTFDRVTGTMKYEGAAIRKLGWRLLMQLLDQPTRSDRRYEVQVIDIGMADQSFVRTISHVFQDRDERQDQPTDQLTLPEGLTPETMRELQEEIPKLEGKITVSISEETGTLILKGTAKDIAKLREFLNRVLSDKALMAKKTAVVKLFNSDPDTIAPTVQALYDDQFLGTLGSASIVAVPTTRSVLVAGSQAAIDSITRIVSNLDGAAPEQVPVQPLTEGEKGYKTFFLKYVSAIDADLAVKAFFGQATSTNQAQPGQPLPVTTIVEERNNSLTVKASSEFIRQAESLIRDLDIGSADKRSVRIGRVFAIKNQRAGDFALILQDALFAGGGQPQNFGLRDSQLESSQQGQQQTRSQQNQLPQVPITDIRIVDRNGELTPQANFYDVRITPNSVSNTIFVLAPDTTMEAIAELIEQLDRLPEVNSELKVFPIVHGDATEVVAMLNTIFNGTQQQAGGQQQSTALQGLPLQSPGTDGSSLINIRFAVNERTNTIIASGGQSELELVEALIYRLDEENVDERATRVYRLSNANVVDVAAAINSFLEQRQTIYDSNPLTGGGPNALGVNSARRNVILVEQETSQCLIVNGLPEYLAEIEHIIYRLDRRPPMVKVKAMLVQVDLNQMENYGISFGIQDSSIFDAGLSNTIGTGFVGLDNPGGQIVNLLGTSRGTGLNISAGDESLNLLLRTLKQKGCANVLFSPTVMTLENLQGRFNLGASIQRVTSVNQVAGGVVQTGVENEEIGITLAITPRVSPDGMIVMFVDVENRNLGADADGTVINTDANGNPIVSRPINQTIAQTTIMARSGQTVSISGLFQESKNQAVTSIPILGDLPVIGPLFQNVENSADRTELMIFLTPYIVDGEDDISALNADDMNRMHWCHCDVAELYGDTDYAGVPYREHAVTTYYPDSDPLGSQPEFQLQDSTPAANPNGMQSEQSNDQRELVFPENETWQGNRETHGSDSRMNPEGAYAPRRQNSMDQTWYEPPAGDQYETGQGVNGRPTQYDRRAAAFQDVRNSYVDRQAWGNANQDYPHRQGTATQNSSATQYKDIGPSPQRTERYTNSAPHRAAPQSFVERSPHADVSDEYDPGYESFGNGNLPGRGATRKPKFRLH